MPVIFESEKSFKAIDRKIKSLIRKAVIMCMKKTGFSMEYELFVLFTGNDEIRLINKEHRNIDRPTDVLSFPMVNMDKGKIVSDTGDYDENTGRIMLGDIVVSVEKAIEQADEYGHGLEREIVFLVIHGLLHLLGFDHESTQEEEEMKSIKYSVLNEMELTRNDR